MKDAEMHPERQGFRVKEFEKWGWSKPHSFKTLYLRCQLFPERP